MRITSLGVAAALAAIPLLSGSRAGPTPADQFAGIAKAYLGMSLPSDWEGIEKLPGTKWAPLPPTSLKNCLPNGDCFARQGTASVGGRNMTVVATGARTMVVHLLFRNMSAPLGEAAVVAALEQAGLTAELARCPDQERDRRDQLVSPQGCRPVAGLPVDPAGWGRQAQRRVRARAGRGTTGPAAQPAGPLHRAVRGRRRAEAGVHEQAA